MQLPSAAILASWPVPNYINPLTRGPWAIIVVIVLLLLVTAILVIRVYSRIWISKGFGLDDVLILVAYIPTAAFAVLSIYAQVAFMWGRHVWDLPVQLIIPSLQIDYGLQLDFGVATTLTKLSMLSLVYRVVSADKSRYRWIVVGTAIFTAAQGIAFLLITIFQCSPITDYWTLSIEPQTQCLDEVSHQLIAGITNTALDFTIVLLPIPYVLRLKLPGKQQLIVITLFAGGLVASLAGAVRTYITYILFSDPNKDLTWSSFYLIISSALELNIAIICASIPPVKPFFQRYLPRLLENKFGGAIVLTKLSKNSISSSQDRPSKKGFLPISEGGDLEAYSAEPRSPPASVLRGSPPPPPPPPGSSTRPEGPSPPSRPLRTQSTYETISIVMASSNKVATSPPATNTNVTGAVTSSADMRGGYFSDSVSPKMNNRIPPPDAGPTKPNLNKPLPQPQVVPSIHSELDDLDVSEQLEEDGTGQQMGAGPHSTTSFYQFVPRQDKSISVKNDSQNPEYI